MRNTQFALKEANEQLIAILNGIDAHIYAADMNDYSILFLNKKMKKDFGKGIEGKLCWKEFRHEIGPCEHCTNSLLLDENNNPTGIYEWEDYNPITKRWYRNYDRAIRWIDGNLVRLQIAVDVTSKRIIEKEQKINEDLRRKSEQLQTIGTLAGGMAHDFNNLLQVIAGNLSVLSGDTVQTGNQKYYQNIEEATRKAKELTQRLITFSTGGKPNAKIQNISHLISQVVSDSSTNSLVKKTTTAQEDLWLSSVDFRQLSIAINNIIANCLEAIEHKGAIDVSIKNYSNINHKIANKDLPKNNYVQITISDDGTGIEDNNLNKVFDPYFSTKKVCNNKGLGLGLSITHSIIKKHKGFIDIQSRNMCGTTVNIWLPAIIENIESNLHFSSTIKEIPALSCSDTILLVDSNPNICRITKTLFARKGFTLQDSQNNHEALQLYADFIQKGLRYKFIILSIGDQVKNDHEASLNKFRELDEQARIILSYTLNQIDAVNHLTAKGFSEFLQKPYNPDDIEALLHS